MPPMPMGGELGIKKNEIWAYRLHMKGPLVPARILDPGWHYDATVQALILDGPTKGQRVYGRRPKFPCKWEDRAAWLASHPDVTMSLPEELDVPDPFEFPPDILFGMGEAALRRIVREEMQAILNVPPKLAYTMQEAARSLGISVSALKGQVAGNYITPSYYNSKPLFTREELERWVRELPDYRR